jgi:prepilin-type N-terminal cleavage/methylation domain-containing protein
VFKQAFTLVELAIVIVIIGLLVGGVLAGQELIAQAKVRAQLKQFQDFDAAVATFRSKYDFLPGDMPYQTAQRIGFQTSYIAGQVNPNGDGTINDFNGRVPPRTPWSESKYFFIQTAQAKMLKGDIRTNNDGQFFAVGVEFPSDKFGNGGIAAISMGDGGLYYFMGPTMRRNDTNISTWSYIAEQPPLTAEQAQNIDDKVDDGKPATGKVRPVTITGTDLITEDTSANNCITAGGNYNVADTNLRCRIITRSVVR